MRVIFGRVRNLGFAPKVRRYSSTSNSKLRSHMPAVVLAFLFSLAVASLYVGSTGRLASERNDSTTSTNTDQQESASVGAAEQLNTALSQSGENVNVPAPNAEEPNSNVTSLSTETTVTNGQAETHVKVNGQEVSVPENGSTTQTISNNTAQTSVGISTQNVQTPAADGGFGFNSSTSFTSSTSTGFYYGP